MTSEDLHILCAALGFTATLMEKDGDAANQTSRALRLAQLIESFCHYAIPRIGAGMDPVTAYADQDKTTDAMIERLKSTLDTRGDADMHQNRDSLIRLHRRLCQRYAAYASDTMIADRVLELLDAELVQEHSPKN